MTMSTLTTRSSTTSLEAGYAKLNDKIDALRRQIILVEVSAAVVLLIVLSTLL